MNFPSLLIEIFASLLLCSQKMIGDWSGSLIRRMSPLVARKRVILSARIFLCTATRLLEWRLSC
jgi:hypothetical protein